MSPDGTVVEKFRDVLENKDAPFAVMTNFNVLTYLPERRAILYGNRIVFGALNCRRSLSRRRGPPRFVSR